MVKRFCWGYWGNYFDSCGIFECFVFIIDFYSCYFDLGVIGIYYGYCCLVDYEWYF